MDHSAHNTSAAGPTADRELALNRAGFVHVAGVDEAGRGAWAGPIVAGAVILPPLGDGVPSVLDGLNDSKVLSAGARERFFDRIHAIATAVGVGAVSAEEFDLLGLTVAGELAMVRAVRDLAIRPDHLLIDAFRIPSCALPQTPIIRGDSCSLSIAAASVVAKVTRDRWLVALSRRDPRFGFGEHKGYGAPAHQQALKRHGPSVAHRHSYAPVAQFVGSVGR